jgi:carbonic anhydrase/acetyltransferase-like protein (isoleucine patch superfamily)
MLRNLLLAVLPPFIAVPLRRWRGAKIARTARIGWLAVVDMRDLSRLSMADESAIRSFSFIRAREVTLGMRAVIKPLAVVHAHTVIMGEAAQISPTAIIQSSQRPSARLVMGDHARIFPFSWLDPGEGISIGNQTAVGGHNAIFTHGSWADYLRGAPVAYGPVVIEENVWLPWRVSILTGVTIGRNSIIMSGSIVTRSIPPNSLAGGSPAKVMRENGGTPGLEPPQRRERAMDILRAWAKWLHEAEKPTAAQVADASVTFGPTISLDDTAALKSGDLLFAVEAPVPAERRAALLAARVSVLDYSTLTIYRAKNQPWVEEFVTFVRRYGLRLYVRS